MGQQSGQGNHSRQIDILLVQLGIRTPSSPAQAAIMPECRRALLYSSLSLFLFVCMIKCSISFMVVFNYM